MKKICPKCKSVVFKTGPVDPKEKYPGQGVDRDLKFERDEKGEFIRCPGCGSKYRYIPMGSEKNGPGHYRIEGLEDSPD